MTCTYFRYCCGRLSTLAAKSAEEQHIQPELLPRGQSYQISDTILWVWPGPTKISDGLVRSESHQYTSFVTGKLSPLSQNCSRLVQSRDLVFKVYIYLVWTFYGKEIHTPLKTDLSKFQIYVALCVIFVGKAR